MDFILVLPSIFKRNYLRMKLESINILVYIDDNGRWNSAWEFSSDLSDKYKSLSFLYIEIYSHGADIKNYRESELFKNILIDIGKLIKKELLKKYENCTLRISTFSSSFQNNELIEV